MTFERIEIGDAILYRGDCREILPSIKADAVITDPPYCIGFEYSGTYTDLDMKEYSEMISCLNGRKIALLQYPEEMMKLIVPILGAPREVLAWVYPSNLRRQFRLWGLWGLDADYSQIKQRARNPESLKVKSLMVNSYDWWEQPQVKNVSIEKTEHPCQIPVSCVERIIKLTKQENIVDPFMGSGTTGVACVNLGKKFVGIERERKYYDIACERIENAQRQGRIFA